MFVILNVLGKTLIHTSHSLTQGKWTAFLSFDRRVQARPQRKFGRVNSRTKWTTIHYLYYLLLDDFSFVLITAVLLRTNKFHEILKKNSVISILLGRKVKYKFYPLLDLSKYTELAIIIRHTSNEHSMRCTTPMPQNVSEEVKKEVLWFIYSHEARYLELTPHPLFFNVYYLSTVESTLFLEIFTHGALHMGDNRRNCTI